MAFKDLGSTIYMRTVRGFSSVPGSPQGLKALAVAVHLSGEGHLCPLSLTGSKPQEIINRHNLLLRRKRQIMNKVVHVRDLVQKATSELSYSVQAPMWTPLPGGAVILQGEK